MQRRGLVTREDCPSDGRGAFVVLTEVGRSAIESAAPGHAATVRHLVFDRLSSDQVAAFDEACAVILDGLTDARWAAPRDG
jgi:DNA-binding MarR family transcriptional regulator